MSLILKNRQRTFPLNESRLRSCALCMLRAAGVADYDLSIRLTTNPVIRRLNAQLRGQPSATDVLSVAPQRTFPPALPAPLAPGVKALGEVIISVEYVHRYGGELGMNLMQRVERLLAHSICHLLGYNHERDEDHERMQAKEDGLMQAWELEKRAKEEKMLGKKRHRRTKEEVLASRQLVQQQLEQRGAAAAAAQRCERCRPARCCVRPLLSTRRPSSCDM